jgi:DNA polymerase III sliding clamp (beta) subunit (PCNA family)
MAKAKTAKTETKPSMPAASRWVVTDARYLRMLVPFTTGEETRYYLRGIHVEPAAQGIILVATDGHRLGAIHDPSGVTNKSHINPVSPAALDFLKKMEREESEPINAIFGNDRLYLLTESRLMQVRTIADADRLARYSEFLEPIDGTFPAWRGVFPQGEMQVPAPMAFNTRYVGDFASIGRDVHFYQHGTNADPVVVRCPEVPEFVGLLMPVRFNEPMPLPAWARAATDGQEVT